MSVQKLQTQLEGLLELEKYLKEFRYKINVLTDDYNIVLNKLAYAGVPSETLETYFYLYRFDNLEKLENLSNTILTEDIDYIKKNIVSIQNTIRTSK